MSALLHAHLVASVLPGMPWPLPWPFDRSYMQLALVAGVVVGATAPLIGVFVVQKGMSLLGDGIGHVAVAGIGASLLMGTSPTWTALVVAIVAALLIEFLRSRGNATGDLALALVFYGGIAAGVVLASRSATNTNLQPYLFGSILTATAEDVWTIVALGAGIAVAMAFAGRALFAVVLDEDSARVAGVPARALNALLAVLTAVTVVAAMRIVGVLLVAALMVLPVATSRLVARSFRGTLVLAVVFGVLSAVFGLLAARQWALAAGGTIVLVAAALFALASIVAGARRAGAQADSILSGPH
jgi:zinc transport system permease protein